MSWDLFDALGAGLCHQASWRTMFGAWLCDRCTGLYLGGALGVAHGLDLARRTKLWHRLLLAVLLIAPMAIDKLVLRVDSPLDVTAWRLATGLLAGAGTGVVLGAGAAGRVRWPEALTITRPWAWTWATVLLSTALFLGGIHQPLNTLVFVGLIMLCAAGTAWALWLLKRLWSRPPTLPTPPTSLATVTLLVLLELVLVTIVPSQYKPHMGWLDEISRWMGRGP